MAAAFGVHLGATSTCLAVCKDGKANVVANDAGDRVTPAVVAFTDHDQVVGLPAKQGMIRNASNTVCNVKHVLGCTTDEVDMKDVRQHSGAKIVEKSGSAHFEVEYKEKTKLFSAEDIATRIYKAMKDIAEHHGGDSDDSSAASRHAAVVTVPLRFSARRRAAARAAAEAGGFRVLRVIDEAAAAALAYGLGQNGHQQDCTVVVYRLGGTSLDASVLRVCNGMYQVLAAQHDANVGGRHFTDLLVQYFTAEFDRQWKCRCGENRRSVAKLRNAAENAKHVLSNLPTATASVESLFDGIDFRCNVSRARFDGLLSGMMARCLQPVTTVLESAGVEKSSVDKVILCGGSTKVPVLQKQLGDFFPNAEILNSIAPDEVIAVGAAKQAALLLTWEEEEIRQNEADCDVACTSTDLLVEVEGAEGGAELVPVIRRYTPVPVRRQETYQLPAEQDNFRLHLLHRAEGSDEPTSLAKVVMSDIKGCTLIDVIYHMHSDGSLHVTCTEPTSRKSESVVIETASAAS